MFSKIILKSFYIFLAAGTLQSGKVFSAATQEKGGESLSKKTAVVNLSGIQEVLPAYNKWKKTIEKQKAQAMEALMKQKTELEKDWQKLEGLRGMLAEPKYRTQKEALEKRVAKLEQLHTYTQQVFYATEQAVFKRLEQEMQKILDELCTSRGVNIVLNGAVVLYVNRSELNLSILDLTSDVARMMEQRVVSLDEYTPDLSRQSK